MVVTEAGVPLYIIIAFIASHGVLYHIMSSAPCTLTDVQCLLLDVCKSSTSEHGHKKQVTQALRASHGAAHGTVDRNNQPYSN